MWRGNPVLTALVFGLPLGFLSLICYSVCCADILDAEEEEAPGKFMAFDWQTTVIEFINLYKIRVPLSNIHLILTMNTNIF